MKLKFIKSSLVIIFLFIFSLNNLFADEVKKIEILGNERISSDTIKLFSEISLQDKIGKNDLNLIIKRLYETDFFKNITVIVNVCFCVIMYFCRICYTTFSCFSDTILVGSWCWYNI